MAITTINSVTGAAWPTSGAVSAGTLGANITGGDGFVNGSGTHAAWDSSDPKTTKPTWSDSAGYVIWTNPGTSTKGAFELCAYTGSAATALTYGGNGVEISFGLQLRLASFTESTTPANDTTRYLTSTTDTGGTGDLPFQIKIISRNIEGFKPGWYLAYYGQTSATFYTADVQGGGNTSYPPCHLAFDEWYQIRMRYKPSAGAASNDGEFYLYVNDVLVMKSVTIDGGFNTASYVGSFLAALFTYGAAFTGVTVCTCGPHLARTYPSSDQTSAALQSNPWAINTTRGFDLRRNYHTYFSGNGSHWTTSGTLSVPATGTRLSTSGTYPGQAYFPISATVGDSAILDTPSLWGGLVADTPFGSDGYAHISFNGFMAGTGSNITGTVYAADNTTELFSFKVDSSTGLFYVNGVSTGYAVVDSHWYGITASLTGGSVYFLVTDRSNDTLTTAIAYSTSATTTYQTGQAIGKARITATGGAIETIRVMGVTVSARHTLCVGDSYASSNANSASPEYHVTAQRMGLYWNASCDGTVPCGYDPTVYAGGFTGVNLTNNLARSGSKLSEFMSNVKPYLGSMAPSRILVMGYDVNDIPASVTTMAAAWTAAEAIATRKVEFCQWAAGRGHTVVVTDGFNLADAGSTFNGTGNYFRRKIPLMVSRILPNILRKTRGIEGKVTYVPSSALVDGNATTMSTDGVHGATAYERQAIRAIHGVADGLDGIDGYMSDWTIEPLERPTARTYTVIYGNNLLRRR